MRRVGALRDRLAAGLAEELGRHRTLELLKMFLVVAISMLLVIPCLWHHRLQAGDLGSHVYNAWLVQLINRGQAPGVWIAPQSNNILFDLILSALASTFNSNVIVRRELLRRLLC